MREHEALGFTEIHMVNGENPHVDFEFYRDTIAQLHGALPDVHLKCYTASEIHHMTTLVAASRTSRSCASCRPPASARCRAAAPRSSPSASAASSRRARSTRTSGSTSTTPRTGWASRRTARILYGHVETYEERVDHLLRLRDQQDKTGGFLALIPLAFHPENTVFERRGFKFQTGAEDLKMIAVSRLLVDNIPNIKAYWISMTMPLAQVALHFGANDVQGTLVREEIFRAAGSTTGTEQKLDELAGTCATPAASRCSATRSTTSCAGGTPMTRRPTRHVVRAPRPVDESWRSWHTRHRHVAISAVGSIA